MSSKKKVLLLSPPFVKDYMRNGRCDFVSNSSTQWYPIWLGYCGALLEKHGHQVKLIDAPAANIDHPTTIEMILVYKPDVLVIYTGKLSEANDQEFADAVLEKWKCDALFVGPFFSIDPVSTLKGSEKVKLGIAGEFEYPLIEYLQGNEPKNIENFLYNEDEEIKVNPLRPHLTTKELDAIPFVSDFFNRHLSYRNYRTTSEPFPFIDIMTGRGCQWGQCSYCLWVSCFIKGSIYNQRSIDSVMEELSFIDQNLPWCRSIMIQDDTFTEKRALEFAEKKIALGSKIPWSCYARGNISYETLKVMAKSGCGNLHVGFESGNEMILENVNKGITRERMTRFAQDAKRAGLNIHGDFAIGFPGETADSIKETINWACQIRPYTAQFQLMIPFPGTPFYDLLEKKGWLKEGVPDYPDLSWDEMEKLAKGAYIKFYLSLPYLFTALANPRDLIFSKFKVYLSAIPSIFWRKWHVR